MRLFPWAQIAIGTVALVGGAVLTAASIDPSLGIFKDGESGTWWQAAISAVLLALGVLVWLVARVEGLDCDADIPGGGRITVWSQSVLSLAGRDASHAANDLFCCCRYGCRPKDAVSLGSYELAAAARVRASAARRAHAALPTTTPMLLHGGEARALAPTVSDGPSVPLPSCFSSCCSRAVAVSAPLVSVASVAAAPVRVSADDSSQASASASVAEGRSWRLRLVFAGGGQALGPVTRSVSTASDWREQVDEVRRRAVIGCRAVHTEQSRLVQAAERRSGAAAEARPRSASEEEEGVEADVGGMRFEDEPPGTSRSAASTATA